jgi:NADP-dependent aldehyde dehydrogenase
LVLLAEAERGGAVVTVDVQGYNPRTGAPVGSAVPATSPGDVDRIVRAAAGAFPSWSGLSAAARADVLDALAGALDVVAGELVAVADAETALGETRLRGEVGRTTGQLRMFGDLLRRGFHVDAIISRATDARPDVRRMMHPIGPVAVFSASNFPLAFSVAGGDTASALAAGCTVVVKAHEAHPHTSILVADTLRVALGEAGLPAEILGLVFGFEAGGALVRHPEIRAAGFTGSLRGGRALFDIASARPDPIPFFGEMGSINPVVVLPDAARTRATAIASEYAGSLTLGAGQFCTNPGLLFVPDNTGLLGELASAVRTATAGPLLTDRFRQSYEDSTGKLADGVLRPLAEGAPAEGAWSVTPQVWRIDLESFAAQSSRLTEEIFGPAGLVITYPTVDALCTVLSQLDGNLTGSVHAADSEPHDASAVAAALQPKVGRLIYNGWPTGVAVCWAMHHGGPWPATTASGHTSVGATALRRWQVPTSYQNWPQPLLPPELRDDNPLGVPQLIQD